jgi:hypothetical protein
LGHIPPSFWSREATLMALGGVSAIPKGQSEKNVEEEEVLAHGGGRISRTTPEGHEGG